MKKKRKRIPDHQWKYRKDVRSFVCEACGEFREINNRMSPCKKKRIALVVPLAGQA